MSADECVIDLGIAEDLQARRHKFCPDPHRKHPADHAAHDGEGEVHRADVLVIGRVHPSPPAMRMIVVGGICKGSISHDIVLAVQDVDNRRDCSFASASARTRNGKGCQFSATKDRAGWEARGGSSSSCPLRVMSGHRATSASCLLFP